MAKSDNVVEMTTPQKVQAAVVPVDVWEQIVDTIRAAPYRDANAALKLMQHIQITEVTMQPPKEND